MASLSSLSTEELERELEQRKGALSGLLEKREELEAELKQLNDQIASGGTPKSGSAGKAAKAAKASSAASEAPTKRRGRPPGSKNKPKAAAAKSSAAGRKRPKNDKPLPAVLAEVLEGKSGMQLDDIHDAVVATGYKTSSKNFKNVIYQNLYNKDEFTKSGDGAWVYKP
ncbi:hypothetical protein [Alienimonas californiensis]|uniref:HTH HARE-type domain-containing protein n=1 Tax=Alienimonas californiensis TaxID=2527989 RepID=A0A517PFA0_9PLAN|nr:hypothetical protein [Alienimonas californiensis]QDT18048.1 hypothetical protein CA12_41870 [Alienimonas californiensis]